MRENGRESHEDGARWVILWQSWFVSVSSSSPQSAAGSSPPSCSRFASATDLQLKGGLAAWIIDQNTY